MYKTKLYYYAIAMFSMMLLFVFSGCGRSAERSVESDPTFAIPVESIITFPNLVESGIEDSIMKNYMQKDISEIRKNANGQINFDSFECIVWTEAENSVVALSSDAKTIDRVLIFSQKGDLLFQTKDCTITAEDVNQFLLQEEKTFRSIYGAPQFDYGSGRYLPAYITTDGRILVLTVENSIIQSITEYSIAENTTMYHGNSISYVEGP